MIVVTGATGTVGSHVVEALLQRGERVRVFSRDPERARQRFGRPVEIAQGDLDDANSIRAALAEGDRLFLLTPSAGEPGRQRQREHNVIAAARSVGVSRVVKLSVLGADEQSLMSYARGHRAAELELEASGLSYTILRSGAFMQGFLRSAADGAIYTCAADGRVALVDVRDVAAVAAVALTEEGHERNTYSLTGPEAISYDRAAASLSEATGRQIAHVRVTPEALVRAMAGAGLPQWLAEDLAAQFDVIAKGDYDHVSGDIAAVTGREPRSLDQFAREDFTTQERRATVTSSMPNIFTDDIGAALAFYRDTLGFSPELQVPSEGLPEHVVLRLGTSVLALSTPRAATAAGLHPGPGNPFELVVWCADVDGETERLRTGGATVVVEPYDHPAGHRRAYVADPDGSWLALVDAR